MFVAKRYFAAGSTGDFQSFLTDVNNAHMEADRANDHDGKRALIHLWLEHFNNFLGNMAPPRLVDYLETRQIWRQHEEWLVLKTVDEPCIAYTAQKTTSGEVTLIALGACYRYPNGSEDEWWNAVILPRVRRL